MFVLITQYFSQKGQSVVFASFSKQIKSKCVTLVRPLRLDINLTASVCTFSSELIVCLQTGSHTTSAYSRIGLQRLV